MDARLAKAQAALAARKAEREALAPLYDAIRTAQAAGDRDAWFAAVNEARKAEQMAPMSRAEFDARNP